MLRAAVLVWVFGVASTGTSATATRPANNGLQAVANAVSGVAQALGVPPNLAIADGIVESGLNPTRVGDGGNSVGVFQLNFAGGEGTSSGLTKQQAENPTLNSQVALTQFAAVQKQYPGASPGALAFFAQRPEGYEPGMSIAQAEATPYATAVNGLYNQLQSGQSVASVAGSYGGLGAGPTGGQNSSATGASTTACDGSNYLVNILGLHLLNGCQQKAIKGGAILVGGAMMMVVGTLLIFKSSIKLASIGGVVQSAIGGAVGGDIGARQAQRKMHQSNTEGAADLGQTEHEGYGRTANSEDKARARARFEHAQQQSKGENYEPF